MLLTEIAAKLKTSASWVSQRLRELAAEVAALSTEKEMEEGRSVGERGRPSSRQFRLEQDDE
jgi:predicted ArsR family transcriptional regulator